MVQLFAFVCVDPSGRFWRFWARHRTARAALAQLALPAVVCVVRAEDRFGRAVSC